MSLRGFCLSLFFIGKILVYFVLCRPIGGSSFRSSSGYCLVTYFRPPAHETMPHPPLSSLLCVHDANQPRLDSGFTLRCNWTCCNNPPPPSLSLSLPLSLSLAPSLSLSLSHTHTLSHPLSAGSRIRRIRINKTRRTRVITMITEQGTEYAGASCRHGSAGLVVAPPGAAEHRRRARVAGGVRLRLCTCGLHGTLDSWPVSVRLRLGKWAGQTCRCG